MLVQFSYAAYGALRKAVANVQMHCKAKQIKFSSGHYPR